MDALRFVLGKRDYSHDGAGGGFQERLLSGQGRGDGTGAGMGKPLSRVEGLGDATLLLAWQGF